MTLNYLKVFLILSFLFLANCGFKVLDKTKIADYSIEQILTKGDKRISFLIKNNLLINSNQTKDKKLFIDLNTKKTKKIKEKNIKGEITKYEIILITDTKFYLNLSKDKSKEIKVKVSGDYVVGENYSTTLSNEKKLIDDLVEKLTEEILYEINFKLDDI